MNSELNPVRLKVVEIFSSIEGEGIRTGLPCVFIRLHGCNLNCSYCDSRYACEGNEYIEMNIPEILDEVEHFNIPYVTVTGGEPLIHPHVYDLIDDLIKHDFEVNIETNGSVYLERIAEARKDNWYYNDNTIITMDYKCISSNMSEKMIPGNLNLLKDSDVVKFVVGSRDDLDQMRLAIKYLKCKAHIFVSPVFGKIEPEEIVNYILEYGLINVRVQVQLHKIIWDPSMRGV